MTSDQGDDFVLSDDESFSMPVSAKSKVAAKKAQAKSAVAKPKATKADGAAKKKKAEPLAPRKSNETAKDSQEMDLDDEVIEQSRAGSSARDTPVAATTATTTTKKSATQTYQKVSKDICFRMHGRPLMLIFCASSYPN